jgi:hypothetical protein
MRALFESVSINFCSYDNLCDLRGADLTHKHMSYRCLVDNCEMPRILRENACSTNVRAACRLNSTSMAPQSIHHFDVRRL